jgi:hypothetical protein
MESIFCNSISEFNTGEKRGFTGGYKFDVFHDVRVPITSSRNHFVMLKPQRHRGHGGTTKYEIRNVKFEKILNRGWTQIYADKTAK